MARAKLQTATRHEALASFPLWVEHGLKPSIKNVIELQKGRPQGITNPILVFAVPRAMNYVVERYVLEVLQAWELLNVELRQQSLRPLGVSHKYYRHLKRIRNKLIAHRIENRVKSPKHQAWYTKAYGSYESVLRLVERAAERVVVRIERLEEAERLNVRSTSTHVTPDVARIDIDRLLDALKAHGIY